MKTYTRIIEADTAKRAVLSAYTYLDRRALERRRNKLEWLFAIITVLVIVLAIAP
jgi:hypothetical protein